MPIVRTGRRSLAPRRRLTVVSASLLCALMTVSLGALSGSQLLLTGDSIAAAATPANVTLFSASAKPAVATDSEARAIEVGVKFVPKVKGTAVGVRFYKGSKNTGTHVGTLWSASGGILARVAFANETASGWQTARFVRPIALTPGTRYVISYHMAAGHYSVTSAYFNSATSNGALSAPASASVGGNGVYTYNTRAAFPTSSFNATNYWTDVIFAPAVAVPTTTTTRPKGSASGIGSYVTPHSVGYQSTSMPPLNVHNPKPPGTAEVIHGSTWRWQSYGLRNDDDNPGSLEHVRINAPLYWTGRGTLSIHQSIIDSRTVGYGGTWSGPASVTVGSHGCDTRLTACSSSQHATLAISNSTVLGIAPPGQDVAPVWSYFTGSLRLVRNDFSGYPQGADPGDGSFISQNYFHGFRQPLQTTTAHMDGIFIIGNNVAVSQNYIDGPGLASLTGGIFIQNTGSNTQFTGISITANYINMANTSKAAVRNQSGSLVNAQYNTLANTHTLAAEKLGSAPRGTYTSTSNNNVHVDGSKAPITNLG